MSPHRHQNGHSANVLIIQEHLPEFRVRFYQELRTLLAQDGINLELIYAPNQKNNFLKGHLDWATPVPIKWFKNKFAWQPVLNRCRKADLVIVQQETKYLINLILIAWSAFGGPKVAYWGHGKNFQSSNSHSIESRIKNWLATKVNWWFAYNDLCTSIMINNGFPAAKITSVGNSIDTTTIVNRRQSLTAEEISSIRSELNLQSQHVAVYTGGLYPNKRIDFLIESACLIREKIADFEFIIIGDGPERHRVAEAAMTHAWIHDVGPKNDHDKVPYWALADMLLMPGLVGLVVVDSFALGVPLITTDYPYHSPEVDYLKNDCNGMMIPCGESRQQYANEVIALFNDPNKLARLKQGALASATQYTIENMAQNFANGIVSALK